MRFLFFKIFLANGAFSSVRFDIRQINSFHSLEAVLSVEHQGISLLGPSLLRTLDLSGDSFHIALSLTVSAALIDDSELYHDKAQNTEEVVRKLNEE